MTLKLSRFLTDAMNKQAKISHFGKKLFVGTPSKLVSSLRSKIIGQYGELFLNDANYLVMTSAFESESDFKKLPKKFVELVSAVLDTEVALNEVKIVKDSSSAESTPDADDIPDENAEDDVQDGKVFMLVKITTK